MICRVCLLLLFVFVDSAHSANNWYVKVSDGQPKTVLDKNVNKESFVFFVDPFFECKVSEVKIDKIKIFTNSGYVEKYEETRSLSCHKLNDENYFSIRIGAPIKENEMHGTFNSVNIQGPKYYYNIVLGYIELGRK